jgi:hypothetical protein
MQAEVNNWLSRPVELTAGGSRVLLSPQGDQAAHIAIPLSGRVTIAVGGSRDVTVPPYIAGAGAPVSQVVTLPSAGLDLVYTPVQPNKVRMDLYPQGAVPPLRAAVTNHTAVPLTVYTGAPEARSVRVASGATSALQLSADVHSSPLGLLGFAAPGMTASTTFSAMQASVTGATSRRTGPDGFVYQAHTGPMEVSGTTRTLPVHVWPLGTGASGVLIILDNQTPSPVTVSGPFLASAGNPTAAQTVTVSSLASNFVVLVGSTSAVLAVNGTALPALNASWAGAVVPSSATPPVAGQQYFALVTGVPTVSTAPSCTVHVSTTPIIVIEVSPPSAGQVAAHDTELIYPPIVTANGSLQTPTPITPASDLLLFNFSGPLVLKTNAQNGLAITEASLAGQWSESDTSPAYYIAVPNSAYMTKTNGTIVPSFVALGTATTAGVVYAVSVLVPQVTSEDATSLGAYIKTVCITDGFDVSTCRPVVGLQQTAGCVGYFHNTLGALCTAACVGNDVVCTNNSQSTACACQQLASLCTTNPSNANLPMCACISRDTSPLRFQVGDLGSSVTLTEYTSRLPNNRLPSSLQTQEPCWWPPCTGQFAALQDQKTKPRCEKNLVNCFAAVNNVVSSKSSQVSTDISEACASTGSSTGSSFSQVPDSWIGDSSGTFSSSFELPKHGLNKTALIAIAVVVVVVLAGVGTGVALWVQGKKPASSGPKPGPSTSVPKK